MSLSQNSKILASDVAPKAHAGTATTYGIGTDSNYGHVKLSDSTSSTSSASAGIAASPKAVKAAYDKAVEAANSGGSKSVGDLWFGIDPKSKPANVQLYAGQSLSRSSYSAHWAFVNGGNRTVISESEWQSQVSANGFCPYYSSGDGSSTYRMPLIKGVHPKFVEAISSAGQYLKAGLPDHDHIMHGKGTIKIGTNTYGYISNESTNWSGGGSGSFGGVTTIDNELRTGDASESNSIYGTSNTVQPPSLTFAIGEYVVGSMAVIGEANAASLLASVTQLESGKLDRSSIKAYITETWSSGTEWYRKWNDGWIEQGEQQKQIALLQKNKTPSSASTRLSQTSITQSLQSLKWVVMVGVSVL